MKSKSVFLFVWSIFSGFGIIFAIESWCYELLGVNSYFAIQIKGVIAIIIGFSIGCIHFYVDNNDSNNNNTNDLKLLSPKSLNDANNKSSMMEVTALMSLIAGTIENEIVEYDDDDINKEEKEKEGLLLSNDINNNKNTKKDSTISLPAKIDNVLDDIPVIELVKLKDKTYPSPNECYKIFTEAHLTPPRFLLPPQDVHHIPPHIVALKFISKYNKKNL